MKFLSELSTCCGSATIKTVVDGPLPEENEEESELINRSVNRRMVSQGRKLRKTENWKPALHVISEDKTIADFDRSGNKRASKNGVKSGRPPKRFGDSYWKMSYAVAMPAFSGMLF
ncbi:uncharacterized protein LOC129876728 [Solanum dulcamara]|uniref:uncharacterized protein LOC129876728 n=1 Tax=Solanum dulcamara TaxID=45834 RepID=UPI002485E2A4|nr:uncharacterized protein LOC129876728 [Solanum dulcamara]